MTYKYIFPIKPLSVVRPLYFDLQIYIATRRRRGLLDFLSPIAVATPTAVDKGETASLPLDIFCMRARADPYARTRARNSSYTFL